MQDILSLSDFLKSDSVTRPFATVIGRPIYHSLSPLIHNAALKALNLDATYYAVEVASDEIPKLADLFNHDNFIGSNVTIPFKSAVVDFLDHASAEVNHTNACNTVKKSNGKIYGYNTDINGFLQPLLEYQKSLEGTTGIVFGSGGASKAIIYALQKLGLSEVVLVSRNPSKMQPQKGVILTDYANWKSYAALASIIVNATPLGMYPDVNSSPVSAADEKLLAGKMCYDIVYRPTDTHFLKQCTNNGGTPVYGTAMFIGQAAEAFKIFTGKDFPKSLVEKVLNDFLIESTS